LRTGEWKLFCPEHKKQPFIGFYILLFVVGVGIIAYINFLLPIIKQTFEETQDLTSSIEQEKLEPFQKGTFGILVSAFEGESKELKFKGKEIRGSIAKTLNALFQEIDISDAEARKIPVSITIKKHEDAREFGKKHNADIVFWGNVTLAGFIPNLTIVDPKSYAALIVKPDADITILKDNLTHEALRKITNIRLPEFTEEPTSIALFATGLKLFKDDKYDKALNHLNESLPKNPSKYIDSATIYSFIGMLHVKREEYDKAISS
jgi:tetratricopeptide (TPR) repeat protein